MPAARTPANDALLLGGQPPARPRNPTIDLALRDDGAPHPPPPPRPRKQPPHAPLPHPPHGRVNQPPLAPDQISGRHPAIPGAQHLGTVTEAVGSRPDVCDPRARARGLRELLQYHPLVKRGRSLGQAMLADQPLGHATHGSFITRAGGDLGPRRAVRRGAADAIAPAGDQTLDVVVAEAVLGRARLDLLTPGLGLNPVTVVALRALLRFLHLEGVLERSLAGAVPSVAGWRLSGLPKRLEPGQVDALLDSCDRSMIGLRDLAILTVLARLGCVPARLPPCRWRTSTGVPAS
jgi:hypothetical protein